MTSRARLFVMARAKPVAIFVGSARLLLRQLADRNDWIIDSFLITDNLTLDAVNI